MAWYEISLVPILTQMFVWPCYRYVSKLKSTNFNIGVTLKNMLSWQSFMKIHRLVSKLLWSKISSTQTHTNRRQYHKTIQRVLFEISKTASETKLKNALKFPCDVNSTTAVLEKCKSLEVWNPACEAVIDFRQVCLHNGSATEMTELFSFEEMFCSRNLPGRHYPSLLYSRSKKKVAKKHFRMPHGANYQSTRSIVSTAHSENESNNPELF